MRSNARKVEFNVNAYLTSLIGRENVSKLEGAVLEIVKNAYDADAKVFCLYYSKAQNCIYLMDNGTGMEEEVIRKHWMTIGNSSKKISYLSGGKRIQTGAKGIGRFALDRLSSSCKMLTVCHKGGLEWIVNWEDFNSDEKKISDVKATIYDSNSSLLDYVHTDQWVNQEVGKIVKEKDFTHTGTVFCLENLRDSWDDKTMTRVRAHLENLIPPDMVNDFEIFFFDDTTSTDKAKIISANIDSYDYKIDFYVEDDDLIIELFRNEFDFGGDEELVYREAGFDEEQQAYLKGKVKEEYYPFAEQFGRQNCIGKYEGHLFFNKIVVSEDDRKKFYYKDIAGRGNLTKKFGGIKIYRDKFRVRPYGESGGNDFDWLELSNRRNRSPAGLGHPTGAWRVGADQILGSIYISRENTNLEDAANRNGIQDGVGFTQLKQVLIFVIKKFEQDRQSVGRILAAYAKKKDEIAAEEEKMRLLAEARKEWEEEQRKNDSMDAHLSINQDKVFPLEPPTANPVKVVELVDAIKEQAEESLQELRDEGRMLQTLATTGIITNMFMHEIRTLTTNIGQELDAAYEAIVYDKDVDYALGNIQRAIAFKKNFASWFNITIEAIRKDKRMRKKHNIKVMLGSFITAWKMILEKSDVILFFSCDEGIEFFCFEFDVENILSNLLSNSLNSFERERESFLEKREIHMDIQRREKGFLIDYYDTGWGLVERYKERPELILEPFESSKVTVGEEEDGTGMGMWIVNKTVLEYNGSIDLKENRMQNTGFYIKIRLGDRDEQI